MAKKSNEYLKSLRFHNPVDWCSKFRGAEGDEKDRKQWGYIDDDQYTYFYFQV